jgi:hypothetical protein
MSTSTIMAAPLGAEILRQGRLFLNLIETRSNSEWDNPDTPEVERALAKVMRDSMEHFGWVPGQPYCIAWGGAMVKLALERLGLFKGEVRALVEAVITPGVMNTVEAAKKRGMLSQQAEPGAIWLARWGTSWRGHAGLVKRFPESGSSWMDTIEANTSAEQGDGPKQREGDGIFAKGRRKDRNGALITQGFINPGAWLKARAE